MFIFNYILYTYLMILWKLKKRFIVNKTAPFGCCAFDKKNEVLLDKTHY